MDSFERHLVQFVLTWEPFGGPCDEDTFPRFGLRAALVKRRFNRILARVDGDPASLDHEDAELMRRARELVGTEPQSGARLRHRAADAKVVQRVRV